MKKTLKDTADFVQITRGYLADIRRLQDKSPLAVSALLFLTERMTKENAVVISQLTLAEILKCNRVSVANAIKLLQSENWVQVVKIGKSNGYLVNSRVAWRSFQNKRYGYFNAEVIVSETEQTQTIEELEKQPLKVVETVKKGEQIVCGGEDLPPPDQKELFEPDANFIPHIKENN